nr:hypothetical protein CFP56_79703 [Quercus suber]
MHSPSTPSAPYQFRLGAPSQSMTGSATQFTPYPSAQQHSSTPNAPLQLGAHHNSNSSNPTSTLRQKNKRVVTSKTLKASKNASRYMEAIKHAGSQSSVQGPRK